MDEAVKLIVTAALLAAGAAHAQPLADPTRPPAMLSRPAAGPAASAPPAGPVLQSVLIARHPGGRQVAVIDGETVRLGGTFRGAVLVRMSETEVELQRGSGRQVLKLFASPKNAK
jgi:MSHA biogenesis protein MshK